VEIKAATFIYMYVFLVLIEFFMVMHSYSAKKVARRKKEKKKLCEVR